MLKIEGNRLIYLFDSEKLWIEPWGENALRVRSTKMGQMDTEDWALNEEVPQLQAQLSIENETGEIRNGKIRATVSRRGKIIIYNQRDEILMEEYQRTRIDEFDPKCCAIEVEAREFMPIVGGDFHLTARWESKDPEEKIYGMGQYQQPYLDLKGTDLELAQRNSQVTVPFYYSSLGYGFFWNNPAVGRAILGKNIISFEAQSTKKLDYWVVAGDTPAEIMEAYMAVTGRPPMMPEYGLGFWQCKLRYQTQEELLEVAREYYRRKIPVDVIVVDFFHWPLQGDWKFDPTYWPDPEAMIREVNSMGMQLMVSVWPSADQRCEAYNEMIEKGYLIRCERGYRINADFGGNILFLDFTNPETRDYLWDKAEKNYYDKGVRTFWLDVAEPEYATYAFDNYRYHAGPVIQVGNVYPREYIRTFAEGLKKKGHESSVSLIRSAWAGSQKYGALVWSGDIASSFGSMRNQLRAGLGMAMCGIPWWTTDIGGFFGGCGDDPAFRELLARWFAWGAFLPVMRLHGDRRPRMPQVGTTGGATCLSGSPNEIWSFGEEVEKICVKYINMRESMRDYIRGLMKQCHEKGTPVMRPMFYEFPQDEKCWKIDDQYMFGDRYLVAPVTELGARERKVYLPAGCAWRELETGRVFEGGCAVTADAPLDVIPVYVKE